MAKTLILGATSAIAIETAKILSDRGDALFLVARSPEKLESVRCDLEVRGGKIAGTLSSDLNDFSTHPGLMKKALEALQGLDLVLIAHGTLGDQKACEQDFVLAEKEIRTNFLSCVSLLTLISNKMEQEKSGTIAVISSVAGDRGRQSNYIYGSAKGALNLFLQGLRNRMYSSGVMVLTIKPGFVDTPMTAALKKNFLFAKPDQIGRGIVKAIDRKKDVVYLPCFWWGIMAIIKAIPEKIFKRLKL
ncbi:MAG: SDR family oxidoreductase [Proteobacteria bacterium]|nr:SDR family oxidoreductase [Pseudomonadota bacterium]